MTKEQLEAIVYDIKHDDDENSLCAFIFKDGTYISGRQYAMYLRDNFVEYYNRDNKINNVYYCSYDKIIAVKEIEDPTNGVESSKEFETGNLLLESDGNFSLENGSFLSLITWREL